jgi:hypothetical protein
MTEIPLLQDGLKKFERNVRTDLREMKWTVIAGTALLCVISTIAGHFLK